MKDTHQTWKKKLHEIIYEADTPKGKLFDVLLMLAILASIALVLLESVPSIGMRYPTFFNSAEWSHHHSIYHRIPFANCIHQKTQALYFQLFGGH